MKKILKSFHEMLLYQKEHPDIALFLRGDSGFATPELYELCETNGTRYAIRLKERSSQEIEKGTH